MEYTNRKGDRYYIFEGQTKTGKPRYFASRKETSEKGKRLGELPESYEIAEHPRNSVVTIRKTKPTRILNTELEFVKQKCLELSGLDSVQVERRGDQMTIFTPDRDAGAIESVFSRVFGASTSSLADWARQNMTYSAMLRLTLKDEEKRIFATERYCFRGSIDNWVWISHEGTLEVLAKALFPTLADESFFELM